MIRRNPAGHDGVLTVQEFEAAGGSPASVGAIAGQDSQSFTVNTQQRWTDTGITVQRGDILTVQSSGQIQLSDNASDVANPAGSSSRRMAPDAPIDNVLAGALIGMISGHPPFAIGNQKQITAPVSGRLYLGMNDDHLPDNRGAFAVSISVQRC